MSDLYYKNQKREKSLKKPMASQAGTPGFSAGDGHVAAATQVHAIRGRTKFAVWLDVRSWLVIVLFSILGQGVALAQPYNYTAVQVTLPAIGASGPYVGRECLVMPVSTPNGIAGLGVLGPDFTPYFTDNAGTFIYSNNVQAGEYYVKVLAPTNGAGQRWEFFFYVTATNLGLIQAATNLSVSTPNTYPAPGGVSWTIAASEARYALQTNLLGSAAFQNLNAFQASNANLNGWALLSTNAVAYLAQLSALSNALGSAAFVSTNQFQSNSANLSNFAQLTTNVFVNTNQLTTVSNLLGALQTGSAALTNLSALGTNYYQSNSANLSNYATLPTNTFINAAQLATQSNYVGANFQPLNTNLNNLSLGSIYNPTASNVTLVGTVTYANGAVNNYVLTVDGFGHASWQSAQTGATAFTNVLQVGSQNLTNWSQLATNSMINPAQLATLSNFVATAYQPLNTNLNNLSIGTVYNPTVSNATLVGTLTYANGATNGFVLTVDGFGHASWQPATGGSISTNGLQVGSQNLTNWSSVATNAYATTNALAALSNSITAAIGSSNGFGTNTTLTNALLNNAATTNQLYILGANFSTTAVPTLVVSNSTAANGTAKMQSSPAFTLYGQAWDAGNSVSRTQELDLVNTPVSFGTLHFAELVIKADGTNIATFDSYLGLTVPLNLYVSGTETFAQFIGSSSQVLYVSNNGVVATGATADMMSGGSSNKFYSNLLVKTFSDTNYIAINGGFFTNGLNGDHLLISNTAIAQSVSAGITLSNASAAISTLSQYSPALALSGNGWVSGASATRTIYLLNQLETNSPLYGQLVAVDQSGNQYFSVSPDWPFTAPSGLSTKALAAFDHFVSTNGGSVSGSLTNTSLTASRVLTSGSGGVLTSSSVTTTTLGYLDATSSVQTQLNNAVTNASAGTNIVVSTNGQIVTVNNPLQFLAGPGVTIVTNGPLFTLSASGGGTGLQNPLTADINAAGFSGTNFGNVSANGTNTARFANVTSNLTVGGNLTVTNNQTNLGMVTVSNTASFSTNLYVTNIGTSNSILPFTINVANIPTIQIWQPNPSHAPNILFGTNYGNAIASTAEGSTILGGEDNAIGNGSDNYIGGGIGNTVLGANGNNFIGGGAGNIISNSGGTFGYSVIPGGSGNVVNGSYSYAAGENAKATNNNIFVWSDGTTIGSTSNQQAIIQATASVGINTNNPRNWIVSAPGTANFGNGIFYPSNGMTTNLLVTGNLITNGGTWIGMMSNKLVAVYETNGVLQVSNVIAWQ